MISMYRSRGSTMMLFRATTFVQCTPCPTIQVALLSPGSGQRLFRVTREVEYDRSVGLQQWEGKEARRGQGESPYSMYNVPCLKELKLVWLVWSDQTGLSCQDLGALAGHSTDHGPAS